MITLEIIDKAIKAHACEEGIKWGQSVLNQELTTDNIEPSYYLWLNTIKVKLDPALVEWCAALQPSAALKYASNLLTLERLDWCATHQSYTALACVPTLLTSERLDWCAEKWPIVALLWASDLLTPERLDWCEERSNGRLRIHRLRSATSINKKSRML